MPPTQQGWWIDTHLPATSSHPLATCQRNGVSQSTPRLSRRCEKRQTSEARSVAFSRQFSACRCRPLGAFFLRRTATTTARLPFDFHQPVPPLFSRPRSIAASSFSEAGLVALHTHACLKGSSKHPRSLRSLDNLQSHGDSSRWNR